MPLAYSKPQGATCATVAPGGFWQECGVNHRILSRVIKADSSQNLFTMIQAMKPEMTVDLQGGVANALMTLLVTFSLDEIYEAVNGLTLQQLLSYADSLPDKRPVSTGEIDGVGYDLYDVDPEE